MRRRRPATCRLLCAALALVPPGGRGQTPPVLPDGAGRDIVERSCSQCHSLETVLRSHLNRRQWEARIDEMIAKGAKLSDEDIDVVAEYLAAYYGPAPQ